VCVFLFFGSLSVAPDRAAGAYLKHCFQVAFALRSELRMGTGGRTPERKLNIRHRGTMGSQIDRVPKRDLADLAATYIHTT
jgi:hypothetical protein